MVDAERTKSAEAHVKSRLAAGKCIACRGTTEEPLREHKKRGLCDRCHARWLGKRATLGTKKKQAEYDAKLIEAGNLLHEHEISKLRADDVFSAAAESVEAQ